jgi:hypothetical protein
MTSVGAAEPCEPWPFGPCHPSLGVSDLLGIADVASRRPQDPGG